MNEKIIRIKYGGGLKDLKPEYIEKALKRILGMIVVEVRELEGVLTKEEFHNILCEFPPSIAEDSGQPEWTAGELDKVWDFIIGKKKFIIKE